MKLSVFASVLLLLVSSSNVSAEDSNGSFKHGERIIIIKVDTPEGVSYKKVPYDVGMEAIKNGDAEQVNPFLSISPAPLPDSEPTKQQAELLEKNDSINSNDDGVERVNPFLSLLPPKTEASQPSSSPSTTSSSTTSSSTSSPTEVDSTTATVDDSEQTVPSVEEPKEAVTNIDNTQITTTESKSEAPAQVVIERDESGQITSFSQANPILQDETAEIVTVVTDKTAASTTDNSSALSPDYCRKTNIGVNLGSFGYFSSELLFNDLAKSANQWKRSSKSSLADVPFDLDENGYIKTLEPNETALSIITDMKWMAENDEMRYVLTYDGEGDIAFAYRKVIKILSQEPGKIVFQFVGKGRIGLALSNINPQNYIRNIQILPESSYLEGNKTLASKKQTDLWDGVSIYRYLNSQKINNSVETSWSERQTAQTFGVKHGISIDDIVTISNQTNTSPWILLPHNADDDYFRQAAKYVKAHLNPDLKVYLELSNETWNWSFKQTVYFNNLAKETDTHRFYQYGKRANELFAIWSDVFAGNEERIVNTIGTQYYNPWVTNKILTAYPELQQSVDAVAIGYYIGHHLAKSEKAIYMSDEQMFDKLITDEIERGKGFLLQQKEIADKFGLDLIAYEAGQHISASREQRHNTEYTNRLIELNRNPRMYDLYLKMYDAWKEVGGKEIVWFSSTAKPSKFGSWGILESMAQDPLSSPKYKAMKEILRKEGC